MTLLTPPSNIERELALIQKSNFQRLKLIPVPLPLLICSMNIEPPVKPSRKNITSDLPSSISFSQFELCNQGIMLSINETIPFHRDRQIAYSSQTQSQGFILSTTSNNNREILSKMDSPLPPSFSNYSLNCYKVIANNNEPFWLNMEWEEIWEVKKNKNR